MYKNARWFSIACILSAVILMGIVLLGSSSAPPGEKTPSLESRLKQLEDREEIRELLMDYGRFLDRRDFDSFSHLFAEKEGEWIGGMGKAKGPQAICRLMEDTIGKDTQDIGAASVHIFTNEKIQIEGDRARASTKWMFLVQDENRKPTPFYAGHYEDSIVRENGRWKFLKRVVYGDIPSDNPLIRK
jgi:hypothetical protein